MQEYIDIMNAMALSVAQASKKISIDFYKASLSQQVSDKQMKAGLPDFVTSTDIEAQKMIADMLVQRFPEVPFVGEEGDKKDYLPEAYFLVDPIDGTSNFVALRDYFACCAAYVEKGNVKASVIADPIRGFLIKAYEGGGVIKTTLDSPLTGDVLSRLPNGGDKLSQYQLECELAMNRPHHFSILENLVPKMSGMRKSGSTALDMANMAMGRRMVLVSEGLEPHDLAAGLLIIREVGGIVTNFDGVDASVSSASVIVGSKSIHDHVTLIFQNIPLMQIA